MDDNKIFHYIKMEEIENNEKINNEEKKLFNSNIIDKIMGW